MHAAELAGGKGANGVADREMQELGAAMAAKERWKDKAQRRSSRREQF